MAFMTEDKTALGVFQPKIIRGLLVTSISPVGTVSIIACQAIRERLTSASGLRLLHTRLQHLSGRSQNTRGYLLVGEMHLGSSSEGLQVVGQIPWSQYLASGCVGRCKRYRTSCQEAGFRSEAGQHI